MGKLHEIKDAGDDVIMFVNICWGGVVASVSYRVSPDGKVSTRKINEYAGEAA